MNITIRTAELSDMGWIKGELRVFSDFYGTKKKLFEEGEHLDNLLVHVIKEHLFLIAEGEGVPVGFIVAMFFKHHFNPNIKVLSEQLWWVSEPYRSTSAGGRLLKELIKVGKESADWITFSLLPGSPVKEDSLTRLGFKKIESAFLMEF